MVICKEGFSGACPTTQVGSVASYTIVLEDGVVGVNYNLTDRSTTTASHSYFPLNENWSPASQYDLEDLNLGLSTNSKSTWMYTYDVFAPEYAEGWVHTTKKQYITARPWLLSILSATILKPKYIHTSLIYIPNECPNLKRGPLETRAYISRAIQNKVYYEDLHQIALVANETYWSYEITA